MTMTSLTAIFGSRPEKTEKESEKLLSLYWNRAELKKEFARLRNEQIRLKDLVKQKEGAAARVQQKLEHLEHLLLDPEWAHSALVHFQFRAVNLCCRDKLGAFAEQLKQQREKKQHSRRLDEWNASKAAESEEIEAQIGQQRLRVQMLEDRLQEERHRLATMSALVKLFRGRSLMASVDQLAAAIHAAQEEENQLLQRYDEIQKMEMPGVEGLDIPTKRMINFTILAFAQQLFLHFENHGLAAMAKEAADKSVGAINYGSRQECDELIDRIHKRLEKLENIADLADILQQRARLIARGARFATDADAIPEPASVATIFAISKQGQVSEQETNLLGKDYWGISAILAG